jgi:hypothetical protein
VIIKRVWLESTAKREWRREGYYLLGIFPLYLRDVDPRERRRTAPWFWGFRRQTKQTED